MNILWARYLVFAFILCFAGQALAVVCLPVLAQKQTVGEAYGLYGIDPTNRKFPEPTNCGGRFDNFFACPQSAHSRAGMVLRLRERIADTLDEKDIVKKKIKKVLKRLKRSSL